MGESRGRGENAPNHSSLLDRAKGEAEFLNAAGVVVGWPATGGIETAGHGLLLRYQQAYAGRHIASERSDLQRRLSERRGSDERSQGSRSSQRCEITIGHFETPPWSAPKAPIRRSEVAASVAVKVGPVHDRSDLRF